MSTALLDLIRGRGRAEFAAHVGADVRFHSPAATYQGPSEVAHILTHISAVLDDVAVVREVADHRAMTTFITATFGGETLQGVVDEHYESAGLLTEATLFLRPYAVLRAAIAEMRTRLAAVD